MLDRPELLRHIKTDLSEGQKEDKSVKIMEKSIVTETRNDSDPRYICSACSKIRVQCPCPFNHQRRFSFQQQQTNQNIQFNRLQQSLNKTTVHQASSSVPKITFTYSGSQGLRNRRASLNTPINLNNQTMYLKSVTTTTVIHPIEQIIYYPVIHNRIKFQTPEKGKQGNTNKESRRKRVGLKRSYMDYSHQRAKDVSTNETKEPMTPQQFRKMTDWLLMEK